jgi:thiosulfate reductase cytochrome b subunit
MRYNVDGQQLLAPYNLVTTWFWIYDDAQGNTRPVRLFDLASAYYENGIYAQEILSVFDFDGNGSLSSIELRIDNKAKQKVVIERLSKLGLNNPRIIGQVQPYSINHNVTGGTWAISDCRVCHNSKSRITQPMRLAAYIPGDVLPEFVSDSNVSDDGSVYSVGGALFYQPGTRNEKLYIFGLNRIAWVDWVGGLFFFGVLISITMHIGLRFARKLHGPQHRLRVRKVYMYHSYERFWHWLQTVLIILLLITGLIIHRPDLFGAFSFRGQVTVHNVSAAILAINAALSLFYHLVTGQIRQFLPRPYGFFDDAIEQARYYLRGIFKREAHPFEKTLDKKLNPLQQLTYLGILNVLLPLQGITGILMWGVQRWPQMSQAFGGLPFLAPFHTLIAWIFATFIIGHVYLTTTGGMRPLTSIKAMITGWEDIESHGKSKSPRIKEEK